MVGLTHVNSCLNVVSYREPNVLIGSNQKVRSQEQGLTLSLFTDVGLPANKREPNPFAFIKRNTETPYRSKKLDSKS